ncbi:hypothetical protein [Streptomyces sp. PD-S100-1]|uniref:hypothetical protein n=1 Tax=Streptomyces sp. PD-S100-1 TaxID=3394351 RepID=UPI0039BC5AF9
MPRQPSPQPQPRSAFRSGDGNGSRSPRRGGPDPRRVRLLALAAVVVGAAVLPLAVASAGQVGDRDEVTAGRAGTPAGAVAGRAGGPGEASADRTGGAGDTSAGRAHDIDDATARRTDGRTTDGRGDASAGRAGGPSDPGGASAWSAVRSLAGDDDKIPAAPRRSTPLLGIGPATAVRCGPEVSAPDGVEAQTCVVNQGDETWARTYYRNTTGEPLAAALTLMGPGDRTVRARCAPGGDDEPETCETPRERTRGTPADYTAVAEFARRGGEGALLLRAGSSDMSAEGTR